MFALANNNFTLLATCIKKKINALTYKNYLQYIFSRQLNNIGDKDVA